MQRKYSKRPRTVMSTPLTLSRIPMMTSNAIASTGDPLGAA
jgi:hypothetical protein